MTRVEQSLQEGGLDDDKFDLFDEEGSAFKPQVSEITWIYYDLKLKRPEKDQHSLKIATSGEEGLSLKEGLLNLKASLTQDNESNLRVALVTFGHWELGY